MTVLRKRTASDGGRFEGLTIEPKNARRDKYGELIGGINLTSEIAKRTLAKLNCLSEEYSSEINPWFALWQEHCDCYFDIPAAEEILSASVPAARGKRLFLAHSYCKIVLSEIVDLACPGVAKTGNRRSLYDWVDVLGDGGLADFRAELSRHVATTADFSKFGPIDCSDLLAAVYQELLPPQLRHLLGEYYTPSWLVEYCIGSAEQHSKPAKSLTVMDPAAGSGSFLAHYIAHLGRLQCPPSLRIVGFDVNPLAVDFCYANALLAISKSTSGMACDVSIYLSDAVVDPTTNDDGGPLFGIPTHAQKSVLGITFSDGPVSDSAFNNVMQSLHLEGENRDAFAGLLRQYIGDVFSTLQKVGANVVVGNPPWITWDGLTRGYRDRVAPQWGSSSLVTSSGWKAKVAAGKTDFSSLFVYRTAQRHALSGAVMVFVLPLSLFQSRLAGAGFRTFRTSDGRTFPSVRIDDFSDVKVFPDAVNRTSVGTFLLDRELEYPIIYKTWSTVPGEAGQLKYSSALAGPLDPSEINSPIVAFDEGYSELKTLVGKSDYRARGGVNTGGANTILWLEVLSQSGSTYHVRNVGKSRRSANRVMTADIESEAVHPLLCGPDMRRWKAEPGKSILFFYSPERPKKAIPVSEAKAKFPRAFEFVSRFRSELEARKEYHRWGCSGPFYELYRIGPYTFSPIKVVWQHTGYRKSLNVSVVDDRSRKLTVPDQKAILIPFEELEEAHYVCAFLSSSVIAGLLDRYLGTDASTHILDYVALRRFDPRRKDHQHLAMLSASAHEAVTQNRPVAEIEREIDAIVASLVHKS